MVKGNGNRAPKIENFDTNLEKKRIILLISITQSTFSSSLFVITKTFKKRKETKICLNKLEDYEDIFS